MYAGQNGFTHKRLVVVLAIVGIIAALAALSAAGFFGPGTHQAAAVGTAATISDTGKTGTDMLGDHVLAGEGILSECTAHCDCPQGWFCYYGTCIRDPETPVYCCTNPGCPPGKWCFEPGGGKGTCPEDPDYVCENACDCGPAHACMEVPGLGKRCVKDENDPWDPGPGVGGNIFNMEVPSGEATYCCQDPVCWAGRHAYVLLGRGDEFACFDLVLDVVCNDCAGTPCYDCGACDPGQSCVDPHLPPGATSPGNLCSADGGKCVSNAVAEAVLGYNPGQLLQACSHGGFPGQRCVAGWRPGGIYAVEAVIAEFGSCGNGICDDWESPVTCLVDCYCGDGVCSGLEYISGNCVVDCGTCGDGLCRSPETPKNCPADCEVVVGDGSCSLFEFQSNLLTDCGCPDSPSYTDYPGWCGDGVCQKGGAIPEHYYNCRCDCPEIDIFAVFAVRERLVKTVDTFYQAGVLNSGLRTALIRKVDQALSLVDRNRHVSAIAVLHGFIQQVNDLTPDHLTGKQAAVLIERAQTLIEDIEKYMNT